MTIKEPLPLLQRFPQLGQVPRVELCDLPSPVDQVEVNGTKLWIKRDDLNSAEWGGNKVRALEFLLAGVQHGDTVVTVGGEGSTHVLATATHAGRLGARTVGLRWRHDMNPTAERIAELSKERCDVSTVYWTSIGAILRAQLYRLRQTVHYIPLGGSVPLGVLAQVNAALELAQQVRMGILPSPERVVVPLGSSGTVAGLALGFAIAGLQTSIIAVQVAPAIAANRIRVMRLGQQTAGMIERITGERVARIRLGRVSVVRDVYGGAYGRPMPKANAAAQQLEDACAIRLDQTYSAKAFAMALDMAKSDQAVTLFWNTFDGRILRS